MQGIKAVSATQTGAVQEESKKQTAALQKESRKQTSLLSARLTSAVESLRSEIK